MIDLEVCEKWMQETNANLDDGKNTNTAILYKLDSKLNELSNDYGTLKKFATGLGLKNSLDNSFVAVNDLVPKVKKCKNDRMDSVDRKLARIGDDVASLLRILKDTTNGGPDKINEEKLSNYDTQLNIESNNYKILNNNNTYSKKNEYEKQIKQIKKSIESHKLAQQ